MIKNFLKYHFDCYSKTKAGYRDTPQFFADMDRCRGQSLEEMEFLVSFAEKLNESCYHLGHALYRITHRREERKMLDSKEQLLETILKKMTPASKKIN